MAKYLSAQVVEKLYVGRYFPRYLPLAILDYKLKVIGEGPPATSTFFTEYQFGCYARI